MLNMNRTRVSRQLLIADAVNCAGGVVVLAAVPAVLRLLDPSLKSRWPLAAALTATTALLARGARSAEPSRADLSTAAAVNAAWVTACLVALPSRRKGWAGALLASIAVLDGAAGAAQFALRPKRPARTLSCPPLA